MISKVTRSTSEQQANEAIDDLSKRGLVIKQAVSSGLDLWILWEDGKVTDKQIIVTKSPSEPAANHVVRYMQRDGWVDRHTVAGDSVLWIFWEKDWDGEEETALAPSGR